MSKERVKPQQFARPIAAIEEDHFQLNEEQAKELKSLYEGTLNSFRKGNLIKGTVLKTSSDGVLVDIDYKSDGLIPLYEFSDYELKKIQPGSQIEVILDELENYDGNVLLSYEKAKAMKAWDAILKLFEQNKPVEGVVINKVKGGLSVDIGIPAFLPGSQVDTQRVTDFDQFVNQTITAYIIKVNQKRGNVIISRRKYLNEQRAESRKKILDAIEVGQVIQGTVKNITNYGVFIDIGGVDGLLHITDMTWGRIAHPSELVKIGDTVAVKVLSFDKLNEKISLGMKQLAENPWEKLPEAVQVGSKVTGHISSITDYGMFVEIQPGIEGLIHISEISWTDRIADLNKHYKVGEKIEALVVSLDKENRRMSLSIKQLEKNPWEAINESYQVGQKIKGKVSNITEFGMFVQIAPNIDGLVHISDLSWTEHIEHPSDKYKKGDEVEAVIIGINKDNKKISLGIKQLKPNPWDEVEKDFPVGSAFEGEVTKLTKFGAFIRLPNGIEGLVHASELGDKPDERFKVGDKAEFKVVKITQEDHKPKIALTLKSNEDLESRGGHAKRQGGAPRGGDRTNGGPRGGFGSRDKKSEQPKTQLQLELEKLRKKDSQRKA